LLLCRKVIQRWKTDCAAEPGRTILGKTAFSRF
jgi:hypothetical protein